MDTTRLSEGQLGFPVEGTHTASGGDAVDTMTQPFNTDVCKDDLFVNCSIERARRDSSDPCTGDKQTDDWDDNWRHWNIGILSCLAMKADSGKFSPL